MVKTRSAADVWERLVSLNLKVYTGYISYRFEKKTSGSQTKGRPKRRTKGQPKRRKRESRGAHPDLSRAPVLSGNVSGIGGPGTVTYETGYGSRLVP